MLTFVAAEFIKSEDVQNEIEFQKVLSLILMGFWA